MGSTPQVRCFHSIIKQSVPSTYILLQSYYNRNQIITVLMNMVETFGVITEEFTINDSHTVTKVSPIMHVDGRISFAFSIFFWECIETRITIDDIDKGIPSQYWNILKKKLEKAKEILPSTCIIGETILPLWLSLVVDSSVITPKT